VVEFKNSVKSNFWTGVVLTGLSVAAFWMLFFMSEEDLLSTHVRKSGWIKLIDQTLGFGMVQILEIVGGLFAAYWAVVHIWKVINRVPDVKVGDGIICCHPAVFAGDLAFDEIRAWSIERDGDHPYLRLELRDSYWSMQGMYRRHDVKLKGEKEQLMPLVEWLFSDPVMAEKFG
jgi:hypothetical protein